MIPALLAIFCCQLAGEALARALSLPLPGPVLGMVLMVLALVLSPRLAALVQPVAQGILSHMSLLFVPAGTGVVGHFATLGGEGGRSCWRFSARPCWPSSQGRSPSPGWPASPEAATMTDFAEIWTYLSRGPLLWLTATLAAYAIGNTIFLASGRRPVANPVLIAVALLAPVLWLTGTPYATYFEGAQFVHFLLGPATVCLALPLWQNLPRVRRAALPMLAALVVGSTTAVVSALAIAWMLGVRGGMLASLAPKSATAPVAIGISEAIGGSPTLTAVLVILTGIVGAVVATPLLNLLGLKDWRARGFAVGVAAHGIGTARALQVHPTAGAFAGLGMGMNAVLTAFLAPAILALFH